MMRRALLACLVLLAAPAHARPAPHPALWKVADADTTVYLLGTIHVLPKGFRWRDAAIDRAIAAAQSLTLEVVLDRLPESVTALLAKLGQRPGLPPLAERVPPARRAALAALMRRAHLPAGALDGYASWAAAVVLTSASLGDVDELKGSTGGVEEQVTTPFRAAGKPVEAFETAEQQLGVLAALPEAQQRLFLASTLDTPGAARADYRALLAAWSRGDAPGIARAFARDPEFTPALREALIRGRNRAWAEQIARRMARPGTVLVAVGAGHLAGPDSLQAMLAAKGLTVSRVR